MTKFNILSLFTLLASCFLLGCTATTQPVEAVTPIANAAAQIGAKSGGALLLPQPTSTFRPTATATTVATYSATGTRTPTPTRMPTKTPAATAPPPVTTTSTPLPPATAAPLLGAIEHVVIISIDGLRPDALELADTPVLAGLRLAGAFSPRARAVVPSVTLVNHASMLGGMAPDKHGIDWNVADPERGKINGPTLFSVAHDAGLASTMVVGKDKLNHLVIPGSVDNYIYAGFTDFQVEGQAVEVIKTGLPAVLFVHLPGVDSAGHLTGWMSPAQMLAVEMADGAVGSIVNAIQDGGFWDKTLLIVTADHGGSGLSHGSDSPEDTTIPWLAVGPGVPAGITLTGDITTYDTAATALHALKLPIPSSWDGQPVLEIFAD